MLETVDAMNKTQKFIGGVAAVMFLATLVFAPWEKVWQGGRTHHYVFAPIWSGPVSYSTYGSPQISLRYGVLATWWLAIGVLTAGGFFATKTKGEHTDK